MIPTEDEAEQAAEAKTAADETAPADETPQERETRIRAELEAQAARLAEAQASGQWNDHDVDLLVQQNNRMLMAIAGRFGVGVPGEQLRAIGEATAACRILVQKGIISQTEMRAQALLAGRDYLADLYQRLEEQALKRQQEQRGPQVVRGPHLLVPGKKQ